MLLNKASEHGIFFFTITFVVISLHKLLAWLNLVAAKVILYLPTKKRLVLNGLICLNEEWTQIRALHTEQMFYCSCDFFLGRLT